MINLGYSRKVVRELLADSVINWLLLAIPVSIFLWVTKAPEPLTFAASALALIPLAGLIGQATEDIAAHSGPALGGILNATFGNATELVVAIIALTHGLDEVVKASITGSILGNALLVLGMSMIAGGWGRERVFFNRTAASTGAATLLLAVTALVMPAVFNLTVFGQLQGSNFALNELSLLVAIVLIATYCLSLAFSLVTHRTLLISVGEVAEEPNLSVRAAVIVLTVVTILTASVEILVDTITATTQALGITEFSLEPSSSRLLATRPSTPRRSWSLTGPDGSGGQYHDWQHYPDRPVRGAFPGTGILDDRSSDVAGFQRVRDRGGCSGQYYRDRGVGRWRNELVRRDPAHRGVSNLCDCVFLRTERVVR